MSRRKRRYYNRQLQRQQKLLQNNLKVGTLEDVFNYPDLYKAGKECCNGVRWKDSVQRFENHLFSGTAVRRRDILNHTWKPGNYVHFMLSERGKVRPIDAPRIMDRQVHKLLTQKVLLPLYLPSMIWNNGASLRGKGFEFSKRILKEDLRRHYRRYGREGYIILIDFKQFFPSVSHTQIFNRHNNIIYNEDLRNLANLIINTVSGGKGMPLGVEPSQAEMIAFPSALDNYIKCQLSIKCAGHYMDDYYVIVPPNINPKLIMIKIIEQAKKLQLTVNLSKTRIIPLRKSFKYCKAKYTLTKTGKVFLNGSRDSVKRARRKIRSFYPRIKNKEMTEEDLYTFMNSTLAYFKNYNDHNRILNLSRHFYSTFGFSPNNIENFRRNL